MSKTAKNKPLPSLRSDDEADRLLEQEDLSEYDLSGFKQVQFEFEPKSAQVNMRMPKSLVDAIKAQAKRRGIPYQRYIRETLERALSEPGR